MIIVYILIGLSAVYFANKAISGANEKHCEIVEKLDKLRDGIESLGRDLDELKKR